MRGFKKRARAFEVLRLAAVAFPVVVILGSHGTSRGQEAGQASTGAVELEDWKVDPLRGPVDRIPEHGPPGQPDRRRRAVRLRRHLQFLVEGFEP